MSWSVRNGRCGPQQHRLTSNKMALITSDCDNVRSLAGVARSVGRPGCDAVDKALGRALRRHRQLRHWNTGGPVGRCAGPQKHCHSPCHSPCHSLLPPPKVPSARAALLLCVVLLSDKCPGAPTHVPFTGPGGPDRDCFREADQPQGPRRVLLPEASVPLCNST